eukprot:Skav234595  [mRNA]  locus=scaffold540:38875:40689:- [translate_table: standard]
MQWFKKWLHISQQLHAEEEKLKAGMPPHMPHILKPKRLLLWKAMLVDIQYDDVAVVDEVCKGVELTGDIPATGIFEATFKCAEITVAKLKERSQADRMAAFYGTRSSGDDEIDAAVLEKTRLEVGNNWAKGPIPLKSLPSDAVVSRRFGLKQTDKVRLIDDMSGSLINQSVQANESPKPQGTDVLASVALEILKLEPKTPVLGRTFDMKSAYKQLALAESSLWASYVAIFNPVSKTPEIYQLLAAPFGATRSVYSFLRVAAGIWHLGAKALSLVWTVFFDDFVVMTSSPLAKNTSSAVSLFFKLLGWVVAEDGSKACDFSEEMSALGICINFSKVLEGSIAFSNTEKRIKELVETIMHFLDLGTMSIDAQRLRGRMQFADGQLFGRVGSLCMRSVTNHAFEKGGGKLEESCIRSLRRFAECLKLSIPRMIRKAADETWYLFTDACFEPQGNIPFCGIGGVLINSSGTMVSYFSQQLNLDALKLLGWGPKKTVIFEAELLALITAVTVWKSFIGGSLVVCYIDNNSARDVAISASARNSCANNLLDKLIAIEMETNSFYWYARVPSPSNIADKPSRLDCSQMIELGVEPCSTLEVVQSILVETLG